MKIDVTDIIKEMITIIETTIVEKQEDRSEFGTGFKAGMQCAATILRISLTPFGESGFDNGLNKKKEDVVFNSSNSAN